jgi:phosphatidylglycerophosphate synthase
MEHIREHRSLLADAERRLLIAIARRLPPWINSDHLTVVGLLSMPLAAVAFANIPAAPWCAAAFVLALAANWFGDSLDGTLARVRNQQRPRYGYFVDHVIDLVGTAALFAGVAVSGLMHPSIAIAVVAAYFLVAAESYLTTHVAGVFRISFAGFGPTELRILLAIGAIVVANKPWVDVAGQHARLFDVGGLVAIAGMIVAFGVSAIRNTRALYLAEPLPSSNAESTQRTQRTQTQNPRIPDPERSVSLCP